MIPMAPQKAAKPPSQEAIGTTDEINAPADAARQRDSNDPAYQTLIMVKDPFGAAKAGQPGIGAPMDSGNRVCFVDLFIELIISRFRLIQPIQTTKRWRL